jgi:hypothetical protein
MNKYLEKIAQVMSEENKQVGKTFALQSAMNVPAHIIGGAVGAGLGAKHLNGASESLSKGVNTLSSKIGKLGRVGKWVSSKVHMDSAGGGKALGVGLGMAAIGGLADLASLKAGLHGKVKEK